MYTPAKRPRELVIVTQPSDDVGFTLLDVGAGGARELIVKPLPASSGRALITTFAIQQAKIEVDLGASYTKVVRFFSRGHA